MLVTLGDVDSAGVLFFASVYRWHERVLFEWLSEVGHALDAVLASGRGLPVRQSSAEYPASATLGDDLSVATRVTGRTATEFVFETVWSLSSGTVVAEVRTRHVSCERDPESGSFVRRPIWGDLDRHLEELER